MGSIVTVRDSDGVIVGSVKSDRGAAGECETAYTTDPDTVQALLDVMKRPEGTSLYYVDSSKTQPRGKQVRESDGSYSTPAPPEPPPEKAELDSLRTRIADNDGTLTSTDQNRFQVLTHNLSKYATE